MLLSSSSKVCPRVGEEATVYGNLLTVVESRIIYRTVFSFSVYTSSLKYKNLVKNSSKMTIVIGGKCVDGVVLVSDNKVTYEDHPPSQVPKLHSDFYHIVTGGAGSTDLYGDFRKHALYAIQSGVTVTEDFDLDKPITFNEPVQTSGVIHLYSNQYNFSRITNNLGKIVKVINKSVKARHLNGELEVLVATQVADTRTANLTYIRKSIQTDVYDYQGIGSSGTYANVFLKPFYTNNITMTKFARMAYFIIRFIEKSQLDPGVGGKPQMYFIPNTGEPFMDKPDVIEQYEEYTHRANEKFNEIMGLFCMN
jgi:20S proteasome alpha/beta subunit